MSALTVSESQSGSVSGGGRSKSMRTRSPGSRALRRFAYSSVDAIGSPSIATTTSSRRIPAASASDPGSTITTRRPRKVRNPLSGACQETITTATAYPSAAMEITSAPTRRIRQRVYGYTFGLHDHHADRVVASSRGARVGDPAHAPARVARRRDPHRRADRGARRDLPGLLAPADHGGDAGSAPRPRRG